MVSLHFTNNHLLAKYAGYIKLGQVSTLPGIIFMIIAKHNMQ